ncbi:DNA adenine methylase [Serratia marcescens]|uniref:DNA adenine methylase n=1 Tax=Serratia marcescens TaxID=615 RepID=UPI00115277AF|nr:DNA adenine methylase [Serratia marcescens]MDU3932878.1 DNA adenine methylase [Serratia liquefaciens]QDI45473.1 DNA adenine methylase [Serratia marcescens]QDI59898.1 DNA adenine methylase [Serratia marcescens]
MGYLGSKAASGAYQAIISQMPPHDTYIETHLGGGAIMLRKPPAARTIGWDIDPETVEAFCQGNPCFLDTQAERLKIEVGDAVELLRVVPFKEYGRTLIYVDPPYLPETRTSRARYRHEYTEDDHRKLIAMLCTVSANVMISGYPSALYDELLTGWRSIQFQVMTRGGPRTEQLWMNFDEGTAYSGAFAGKNYTDRQRIKRKVERWLNNYRQLPPQEQTAILAELIASHAR